MQRTHGVVELLERNERGDADLGGGDHQHVDAVLAQRGEELGGQTGVGLHADADDGDLAAVGVDVERTVAQLVVLVDQHVLDLADRGFRHGEGDIGGAHGRAGLHDHVDVHAGGRQLGEHLRGHARLVRHAAHGGQRFGTVVRDAGDDRGLRAEIGEQIAHGLVVVVVAHVIAFACYVAFA